MVATGLAFAAPEVAALVAAAVAAVVAAIVAAGVVVPAPEVVAAVVAVLPDVAAVVAAVVGAVADVAAVVAAVVGPVTGATGVEVCVAAALQADNSIVTNKNRLKNRKLFIKSSPIGETSFFPSSEEHSEEIIKGYTNNPNHSNSPERVRAKKPLRVLAHLLTKIDV